MAAINKKEARIKAHQLIHCWAIRFASVAWIPGAYYLISANDLAMIMHVGAIFGMDLDKTAAVIVFTTIVAPFIGQIGNSILDFMPIFGWGAKSLLALRVTKSIRKSLIYYFNDYSVLHEIN